MSTNYDLIFVTDSTASMGNYLDAIRLALPELVGTIQLTGIVDRMAIIEYRDYCDEFVVKRSGWQTEFRPLADYAASLEAIGGGDWPEAAKTAASGVLETAEKETIVIWFADAPPHFGSASDPALLDKEKKKLGKWFDWIKLCKAFAKRKIRVFAVTNVSESSTSSFYCLLSEYTNGATICCRHPTVTAIAKCIISLFLTMVKQNVAFDNSVSCLTFTDRSNIAQIRDEKDNAGYLPGISGSVTRRITEDSDVRSRISPLEGVSEDSFIPRFANDTKYKDIVYRVFDSLCTNGQVIAITTNPLFGKLWRAICKDRKDPRRDNLVGVFATAINNLPEDKAQIMKQFIEESYDATEEINERIAQVPAFPALVVDDDVQLTRDELLEINRSCNDSVLAKVGKVLTGVRVIDKGPLPKRFLPLAMASSDLFCFLPHLVVEGTMFSKRPSMIMALICVLTGNATLNGKAKELLEVNKGQWIDQEMPENFSYGFTKFVLKQPDFLTKAEYELYSQLTVMGGIKVNWMSKLTLTVGYKSNKILLPDYKIQCRKCHIRRSSTLINEMGVCGLCCHALEGKEPHPDKSYFYECTTCLAHYAVVNTYKLNVRPKCHYCREKQDAPTVECQLCRNKYILVCGQKDWTCAACSEHGIAKTEEVEQTLGSFWEENDISVKDGASVVVVKDGVYHRVIIQNVREFLAPKSILKARDFAIVKTMDSYSPSPFRSNRKLIFDKEIIERISGLVLRGHGEADTCMMCFTDMRTDKLRKACDRRGCKIKCCVDCLKQWYGQSQPGHVMLPSHILCAFCKQSPTIKLLSKFNRQLCAIKELKLTEWQDNWYYGWCVKCWYVKPYMEKVCAQGLPDVQQFTCEECEAAKNSYSVIAKECPSCGVMTEKVSGCDHITCKCGAHWCYVCGKKQTEETIYEHLSNAHGGYFVVRGAEDEEGLFDEEVY